MSIEHPEHGVLVVMAGRLRYRRVKDPPCSWRDEYFAAGRYISEPGLEVFRSDGPSPYACDWIPLAVPQRPAPYFDNVATCSITSTPTFEIPIASAPDANIRGWLKATWASQPEKILGPLKAENSTITAQHATRIDPQPWKPGLWKFLAEANAAMPEPSPEELAAVFAEADRVFAEV